MKRSFFEIPDEKLDRLEDLAEMLASSKSYKGFTHQGKGKKPLTAPELMIKFLKGAELGLDPFASLNYLYNEHGNLTLNVTGMLALVQGSGLMAEYEVVERTAKRCTITVKRKGVRGSQEFTYTFEEARKMGLTKSANYKNQPSVMLFYRAVSQMVRTMFGDIVSGIYLQGELTDGTKDETPLEIIEGELTEFTEVEDGDEDIRQDEGYDEDDGIVDADDDEDDDIEDDDIEEDDIEDDDIEEDDADYEDEEEEEYESLFDEMVAKIGIKDLTPESYRDGMEKFALWTMDNVPEDLYLTEDSEEGDESLDLEDWVIDTLGSAYPMFTYTDGDGDEAVAVPWSPSMDEHYKSYIKTIVVDFYPGYYDEEEEETVVKAEAEIDEANAEIEAEDVAEEEVDELDGDDDDDDDYEELDEDDDDFDDLWGDDDDEDDE